MARFTGSKRIISADDAAAEQAAEYDIRPDTEKPAAEEEAKKSVKAKSTKKE